MLGIMEIVLVVVLEYNEEPVVVLLLSVVVDNGRAEVREVDEPDRLSDELEKELEEAELVG